MYAINNKSLNIFIFFYVVIRAELIIKLPGAFYSANILIRHRTADSRLFRLVCSLWKRLCIFLVLFS